MSEPESAERQTCRTCGQRGSIPVAMLERVGAPPMDEEHMITYSHLVIRRCGACGAGEIEWLDHDCWDYEEVWDQYEWYLLSSEAMDRLVGFLARCPTPLEPSCGCAVHAALRASCRELPRRGWRTGLEAEEHLHRVRVEERGGMPRLVVEPAS